MCGIFGVVLGKDDRISAPLAGAVVEKLYRCSQTRGSEAAGLAVHGAEALDVLKQAGNVDDFLASPKFGELLAAATLRYAEAPSGGRGAALVVTGHTRLVTNGFQSNSDNNQPVIARGTVGIHNGIIVNDAELWRRHPALERTGDVDTEVLVHLLRKHLDETGDLALATQRAFAEVQGAASIAFLFDAFDSLLLATNTGSLHTLANELDLERSAGALASSQIPAFQAAAISFADLSTATFPIAQTNGRAPAALPSTRRAQPLRIVDHTKTAAHLRRCSRCILPESYPFMEFDADGVCTYCRRWRPIQVKGEEALLRAIEPYRSRDGSPDVIVAFSGGRDSTYGLHYVKNVLKMHPVAFTYDWGMVTDLARRNQARICGKLGVEHILRSANIPNKRRYIRKNIEAWLKKPDLGMVTLFTAGDKQFYHYARQLRKETGIKLVIFCTGNMIEDTPYKTGLCGILEDDHEMTLTGLSFRNEMALLWYYARNYLRNPAYFNESIWDTLWAFWCTFVQKDDFLYLYHYVPWNEGEIVGTIRREYDWEVATDTKSTWRIGDGSAAWYNYIYQTIAGWSEDEVMLSNMIRERHLTREEAFAKAAEYGAPRWPSIREYSQLIGFNCEEALTIINGAPKQY